MVGRKPASARADAKASALLRARKARAYRKRKLERPHIQMWYSAKRRAKRFGLAFNLTPADIIIPTHCPVLGIKLRAGAAQAPSSPSLDRIDNRKGYVRGNVVVISWRANDLKSDATAVELAALARFYCGQEAGVKTTEKDTRRSSSRVAGEPVVQAPRRALQ